MNESIPTNGCRSAAGEDCHVEVPVRDEDENISDCPNGQSKSGPRMEGEVECAFRVGEEDISDCPNGQSESGPNIGGEVEGPFRPREENISDCPNGQSTAGHPSAAPIGSNMGGRVRNNQRGVSVANRLQIQSPLEVGDDSVPPFLYFSPVGKFFVCTACVVGLDANRLDRFKEHFSKFHADLSDAYKATLLFSCRRTLEKKGAKKIPTVYREGSKQFASVAPIDILRWKWMAQCKSCFRCVELGEGWRRHSMRCLGGSEGSNSYETIPCQSMTGTRNWFRVHESIVSDSKRCMQTKNFYDSIMSSKAAKHLSSTFKFDENVRESENGSVRDMFKGIFVSRTECDKRLESRGLSINEVSRLLRFPDSFDTEEVSNCTVGVEQHIIGLMSDADIARQKDIGNWEKIAMVVQVPGKFEKDRVFRFISRAGTLSVYALYASLIIRVVCRLALMPELFQKVRLSNEVRSAVSDFSDACTQSKGLNNVENEKLKRLLFELLKTIIFEEDSFNVRNHIVFADVMRDILCVEVGGRSENMNCPNGQLDDGCFTDADKCGHRLSGIFYVASCIATLFILKYSGRDEREEAFRIVKQAFSPESRFGITSLVSLKGVCKFLQKGAFSKSSFIHCRSVGHGICGISSNIHCSAKELGGCLMRITKEMHKLLYTELLFSEKISEETMSGLKNIEDDVQCSSVGYNAFSDGRNRVIIDRLSIFRSYFLEKLKGRIESAQWLQKVRKFIILFIAAFHLCGGAPARGTEIGSLLMRNTVYGMRHTFFLHNEVMVIPEYNKTRALHNSGICIVSRYSTRELSDIFRVFYGLIAPIAIVMLESSTWDMWLKNQKSPIQEQKEKWRLRDLLTLGLLHENNVPAIISATVNRYGLSFSFSQLRQHMCGLVKNLSMKERDYTLLYRLTGDSTIDESDLSDHLITQAGHSLPTALMHYAVSVLPDGTFEPSSFNSTLDNYREASYKWQVAIGVRDEVISGIGAKNSKKHIVELSGTQMGENRDNDDISHQEEKSSNPSASELVLSGLQRLEKAVGRISTVINDFGVRLDKLETRISLMQQNSTVEQEVEKNKVQGDPLQYVDSSTNREPGNSSGKRERHVDEVTPDSRAVRRRLFESGSDCPFGQSENKEVESIELFDSLKQLQTIHGSGATFTCLEQRDAMEAIHRKHSDVLVILATGQGKTSAVLGSVLSEKGVTVWFSPLNALSSDMKDRMRRSGMRLCSVHDCLQATSTERRGIVMLLRPEDCGLPKVMKVLKSLRDTGGLNRCVIDEAHLVPLSIGFRPAMLKVASTLGDGQSPQVVMLTATAPDRLIGRMADMCGTNVRGLHVIRSHPVRRNIRIRVSALPDGRWDTLTANLNSALQELSEGVKDESYRCIIYCITVDYSVRIYNTLKKNSKRGSTRMEFLLYHGRMSQQTRDDSFNAWSAKRDGMTCMIGTSAIGCGIDVPNVRGVIHAGGARTLVEYWQEAGRGGRDGGRAESRVLFHHAHCVPDIQIGDSICRATREMNESLGNFTNWAQNANDCRRLGIEVCLGVKSNEIFSCKERQYGLLPPNEASRSLQDRDTALCDVCMRRSEIGREKDMDIYRERLKDRACNEAITPWRANIAPSTKEILAGRNLSLSRGKIRQNRVRKLRALGLRLKKYCMFCLVFYGKDKGEKLSLAINCRGEQCRRERNSRCLRCLQRGHFVSECPHLMGKYYGSSNSAQKKKYCASCAKSEMRSQSSAKCMSMTCANTWRNECGTCRLDTMDSLSVHEGDIGENCQLVKCTELCFLCFNHPNGFLWEKLISEVSPFRKSVLNQGGTVASLRNFGTYLSYLLVDKEIERAGMGDMVSFLLKEFEITFFDL